MKTTEIKKESLKIDWHLLDASKKSLGRLATEISSLLIGKHKVSYASHINVGDKVVVVNAKHLVLTGNKLLNKKYYRHSGYAGGLKERNAKYYINNNPKFIIQSAVGGMLPNNRLKSVRMSNLYIYEELEHPHQGQIT